MSSTKITNPTPPAARVAVTPDNTAALQAQIAALQQRIEALENQRVITLDEVSKAISEAARRLSLSLDPLKIN